MQIRIPTEYKFSFIRKILSENEPRENLLPQMRKLYFLNVLIFLIFGLIWILLKYFRAILKKLRHFVLTNLPKI